MRRVAHVSIIIVVALYMLCGIIVSVFTNRKAG